MAQKEEEEGGGGGGEEEAEEAEAGEEEEKKKTARTTADEACVPLPPWRNTGTPNRKKHRGPCLTQGIPWRRQAIPFLLLDAVCFNTADTFM